MSPAHLHMVGNVIVKFEQSLTLRFCAHKIFLVFSLAAILNFGSFFKLEPDGTEVELAPTFRFSVLRTAKMQLSNN